MADSQKSQLNEDLIPEIMKGLAQRGALLFLGSGFSSSAAGLASDEMPVAKELANKIGKLGEFEGEEDLRYASSRYIDDGGDSNSLITMLRETFSVREVKSHHKAIASAPWRRVYTTNYDLCFERAAEQIGKLVETVDLTSPPSTYSGRNNICVHLNGSLNNLSEATLESGFKLTTSSYLSPESFLTSLWAFPFQRDLEFCSAIVFIGYSMYDIEIQKILHENPHYRKKTYFVTSGPKQGRTKFTLEQFGRILPIGAEAFGEAIARNASDFDQEDETAPLSSLWQYNVAESPSEVRDSHVDEFLMRGELSDARVDAVIEGHQGAPILIDRQELRQAMELARSGSDIIITGDFGNGKSILARMLRSRLFLEGFHVFTADQADARQHDDLELLVRRGTKGFLLIDSYDQNMPLVRQYAELKPAKLRLIASSRTNVHERLRSELVSIGLNLSEVAVDELSRNECESFVEIVDNLGYWGDKAALPHSTKMNVVMHDHQAQLSMNLLAILSSPQMVQRVRDIVKPLIANAAYRDTVFAIAIIAANNVQLNSSLVADLAFNNEIFGAALRNDASFKQLFKITGTRITAKSSIFALALISRQFEPNYITEQLLRIVASIENSKAEAEEKREIQKSLLRFSVVERLLPESQRMHNLVNYYEKLKREIKWLKSDPHYWLQYGMARLTYKDYDKAQIYLDQSYALAANRYNYHTNHIDTQQARLFLYRSVTATDSSTSFNFFADAHRLLARTPDDSHKYRQVERYKEVYDQRYHSFSKANRTTFEHACKLMLKALTKAMDEDLGLSKHKINGRVRDQLNAIIGSIESKRAGATHSTGPAGV